MSSPYTDAWPVAPIDLPHKRWQFDLFWGGVTLLFVLAVAGIVVTARTTGGQIAGGLGFGTGVVLCLWAWADVHYHPPQLVISPDIIIGGFKGHGDPPSLAKAAGADLTYVLVRMTRGAHWSLAQPGNPTRVNVQPFKRQDVERACEACGWRLLQGPRRHRQDSTR